jgi:hypothetical protein
MTRNLGNVDRFLRLVGAVAAGVCAAIAPFSLPVRLLVFAGTGVYLLATALAGTCVGYRLMGKSTCSVGQRT